MRGGYEGKFKGEETRREHLSEVFKGYERERVREN